MINTPWSPSVYTPEALHSACHSSNFNSAVKQNLVKLYFLWPREMAQQLRVLAAQS